jgi:glycosyltransferase involved in cell wall biosynthesis
VRGRCLLVGALPLHDVVADLVEGLRRRGWIVDVNGWEPPPATAAAFEWGLSSERPWLRNAARLARRATREVAGARSASRWFHSLEQSISAADYDVAVALTDLAPVGLARLVTRLPIPSVIVSLVSLAQELRLRRWLPLLRARSTIALRHMAWHDDVLTAVDAKAIETAVFPSASWRDAAATAGLPLSCTRVIPFGVDLPATFRPSAPALQAPVRLLWVGRMSPEKGLHLFLDALPELRRRIDLRLTAIAAPGPQAYARQIHDRIARQRLDNCVELRPAVPRPKLVDELARHDLLLFHSIFVEPVAQVLLHAAAAGLPVVGPASACADTLLREGQTAWCYGDRSPRQIAAAIARAVDDGDERVRRARALYAEVRAAHTLDATIEAYDQLLQRRCRRASEVVAHV